MQNMSDGKTALGLDANVGALICYLANIVCYLGVIYSIIVLVTDKTNKLTRFHAVQSLLLIGALIVVGIPLYAFMFIGVFVDAAIGLPLISGLAGLLIFVLGVAVLVFTVLAAIKGYGGEMYKIPIIGNFAEKWSA
ncbi:MAG TPA: DUF4870 domain-containing protein [Pyrinomonadaceae bacterium]|nr:DUF4870 domain-containing protein [Pyrinomonadaceae bacterium]